METSQQELEQQRDEHEVLAEASTQDEDDAPYTERDTTANIPIVRGNTPRLFPYHPMPMMLQEHLMDEKGEGYESIPPFPSNPPSAPPLPEEETGFDEIQKSRLPEVIQPLQEEQGDPFVPERRGLFERRHKKRDDIRVEQRMKTPTVQSAILPLDAVTLPLKNASSQSFQLIGFAIYLLCLLLLVFTLAVVQGVGAMSNVLAPDVALLGVPWMVLVYGLLAGCVSCLVTLGRYQHINPPVFVLITWYARPFAAAVLALFAYLLLNSGLLFSEGGMAQHQGFALVVGAIAGLCEGWLFLRRSERV